MFYALPNVFVNDVSSLPRADEREKADFMESLKKKKGTAKIKRIRLLLYLIHKGKIYDRRWSKYII